MTLRQALLSVDLDKVFKHIWKKDQKNCAACDRPTIEQTRGNYSRVVKELLGKPKTTPYKLSWLIQDTKDWYDGNPYVDVCLLNPKYVEPKKGLKPWGGTKGKKVPKGYYDCNADKHNKRFACGFTSWSKMIDTPIIMETKHPLEKAIAELLWELTFYGWTEEKCEEGLEELKERIDESAKEIKAGKCVKLPKTNPDGFDIIIPDSISQQLIDISNGKKSRRK